jgi:hypothetical protein
MVRVADTTQVMIVGTIAHFDWQDIKTVSVTWYVTGWGKYKLQGGDESTSPAGFPPVDRAVDIYFNKWVHAQLFSY